MTIADAVVKSMKAWSRKEADLYPTPVDATESILPVLKIINPKSIWEPACGYGLMSRVLEAAGFDVISSDLRPYSGYGTGGVDFLADERQTEGVDMIVTNPPFSHAEQFIRRALEYTPNVAMLLKGTYWHAGGRLKLFEECRPSFFLPLTWRPAFLKTERGKNPIMEVAWAVWTDHETGYGLDGNACIFEPIRKLIYPGYGGVGLLESMEMLEGELDALTQELTSHAATS